LKDEVQIVEYPYAIEEGIRKAAGEEAVKGVICPALLATWDRTDVPGIKFLHQLNAEWHPEIKDRHWVYLVGWNYARVSVEGIKKALDKVGYDKLDGPAIKEGLESLKSLDMMGIIAPVSYSPEVHVTFGEITLVQYAGEGRWQPISPSLPMAPWSPEMLTQEYWK
jgi:branched-chain amino acid transport system substrate-binding protein